MLIEHIFELREPGPPGRLCTPITDCFHDKTIICKEDIRLDCYFVIYCKNIAGGSVLYFLLPGSNHLQSLTPKCKILNVFWT